jgi:two-component system, CitB family, response regulator DctR
MINVVLIEDDPMVQEVNRQFVNRVEGFQVIGSAGNGVEGVELIRELHPDLALVDIYMPDSDGLATLHTIRTEGHRVDIIAITAASDTETIRTFIQQGAFDYIVKPFKFERIKKSLENYRTLQMQFQEKDKLSQQDLDEIFFQKDDIEIGELPKGLNQLTLTKIISYLMQNSAPVSAENVAVGVGLARVTARRYLDYLEKCGKLELDIHYGGVGRPMNTYKFKK